MTIPEVIDELYHQAHKAAKIPRRDKREPGRKEKEAAEARIYALTRRVFRRQQAQVVKWLEIEYPGRKAVDVYDAWAEWDEDETDDLIAELQRAVKSGVKLFASTLPGMLDLDFALINKRALAKARQYTYELVKGITATTRDTLQRVISAFVETPGMTIGDVVNSLPYSEERALRVAVTEITRAYSTAAQDAAADLKEKYPDVRVTKTWFTNNDDLVCEICAPLNGVEIDQDEQFGGEFDGPPGHVSCRCFTSYRTRIGE